MSEGAAAGVGGAAGGGEGGTALSLAEGVAAGAGGAEGGGEGGTAATPPLEAAGVSGAAGGGEGRGPPNAAAGTKMWAAVALRGISKKMKVAAAQRVVVSLRAQQCSLVGDHLDG